MPLFKTRVDEEDGVVLITVLLVTFVLMRLYGAPVKAVPSAA